MLLDDEDIALLRAVSAGDVSWREGMYDLGLTNVDALLALLAEYQLPSPFIETDDDHAIAETVRFIVPAIDDDEEA